MEQRLSRSLAVNMLGFELVSTNVTAAGLQVECRAEWMDPLRARWSMSGTPVEVVLPGSSTVQAECAIAYVSNWNEGFLIGLKIVQMDEPCSALWQDYLERLAEQDR